MDYEAASEDVEQMTVGQTGGIEDHEDVAAEEHLTDDPAEIEEPELKSFSPSPQHVEEHDTEYVGETEQSEIQGEFEGHEEITTTVHEEYPANEEFVTEEPYQQEVVNDEVVEEEIESSNVEGNVDVGQYQEELAEDFANEESVAQEELVSDQIVEGQEEEISSEQHIAMEESLAGEEQVANEDVETEPQQEEMVREDEEIESPVTNEPEQQPQDVPSQEESDEDFDNVVEVEQKVESDVEDNNVAEHDVDSDNEGDDKTEEFKLGNVSDDDLRGASSGSEHEASDGGENEATPVKKPPTSLESDDNENKVDENKKREQEAALKMFDSDSEEEEQEGVGELIADIFGESDDEGEEFTGFGAEEVSKNEKKKKASAISDDSDDDSLPARAADSDDDDVASVKPAKKSQQDIDSDSDEGVKGGSFQGMSDFDIMLAKKKAENKQRRRRKDNSTFITDADDIINAMLTKMKEAAESDREANTKRKPALSKLKMLPTVVRHLKKQDLKENFVDNGVIAAIADWLTILPDRSLPHITIRTELLKVLHDLPSVGPQTLKHSGIGKAIMILFKHPKEIRANKDSAGRLINKWSRPIFGLNENFKSMTREEREQRDLEQMPQAKRRKLTGSGPNSQGDSRMDTELGQLRPGEAGFVMRARVPMPSTKDYVVRPKWNIDNEDKGDDDDEQPARIVKRRRSAGAPRTSKKDERLDKHIRSFAEKKKHTKLQRAVKISIEGNKMSIL